MSKLRSILAGVCALAVLSATPAMANTIETIKDRGAINCPVPTGGYVARAEVDDQGNWSGLDVDLCRALAAAILGDPQAINFVPISWAQRFPTLQAGDIDIIVMSTGWTLSRDTEIGLDFATPYFLTGLQFLVRVDSGIETPADLNGGAICATGGTTMERQTSEYMLANQIEYEAITFENTEETASAFFAGRCDAIANPGQSLGIMAAQQPDPSLYKIIPDAPLSLETNAMAVRGGDQEMLAVANWVRSALLEADILDITSENIDDAIANRADEPRVAYLLGVSPGAGARLGLSETWAQDAIRAVGNYGEIYDRYLGADSPYNMEAGINAVYTEGGVHYPNAID